ncbi:hypothetical protein Shy_CDS0044 [Escherichia phage Shy]|uniref:Uncharacterized protein n=1 Tax=Escherichia phage Halfdan TaxID=2234092 RepID=A0A2Z5H3D6_9CAUD|nr:hypothetical protein P7I17_gp36 [Escherichia phage Halfdan]AXC34290.1 hypothetical protein [Escherichia phage Halfdan]WQZ00321.1 hypothetical protein Shy_CDS0044 [Escherichia phage Shy]
MTVQRHNDRIAKNGSHLESAKTLKQALDNLKAAGLKSEQLDERTHSIYGWTFGNDDKGYYFYRNYNQA